MLGIGHPASVSAGGRHRSGCARWPRLAYTAHWQIALRSRSDFEMTIEMGTTNSARVQLTERLWQEVARRTALLGLDEKGLGRVRGLLDTVAGRRQPELGHRQGH